MKNVHLLTIGVCLVVWLMVGVDHSFKPISRPILSDRLPPSSLSEGIKSRDAEGVRKYLPSSSKKSHLIHLKSGTIDVRRAEPLYEADPFSNRKRSITPFHKFDQFIIHLSGDFVSAASRSLLDTTLEKNGGKIIHYIPENNFIAYGPSSAAEAVEDLPFVSWVGGYRGDQKISSAITEETEDTVTAISMMLVPDADASKLVKKWSFELSPSRFVSVGGKFIQGDLSGDVVRNLQFLSNQPEVHWIEPSHGTIVSHNRYAHSIVQNCDYSSPQNNTPFWNYAILGDNQIVGVADTGLDLLHCFFYDDKNNTPNANHRKVVMYKSYEGNNTTPSDIMDGHGTHVAGSICGYPWDANNPISYYSGGAPNSRIAFVEIGNPASLSGLDAYEIYDRVRIAGAHIHVDTWGTGDFAYPTYDIMSAYIDYFQYEYEDFLIVRSAGNEGNSGFLSTQANSKNSLVVGSSQNANAGMVSGVGYLDLEATIQSLNEEACDPSLSSLITMVYGVTCNESSNTTNIETTFDCCNSTNQNLQFLCCPETIKATYSHIHKYGENTLSSFSGRGPTYDLRMKPDVVAPGEMVTSARSLGDEAPTCGLDSTSLIALSGTSQAAAQVGALAALVRQYYINGFFPTGQAIPENGFTPSAALVKGTIINSARLMKFDFDSFSNVSTNFEGIADYGQGFGRVGLSCDLPLGSQAINSQTTWISTQHNGQDLNVESGDFQSFCFLVGAYEPFSATLTWTDPPSSPAALFNLVNNLDLLVETYDGTYYGNNIVSPNLFEGGIAPDSINNVEKVFFEFPYPGYYTIAVLGTNVPYGPQNFSLIVSGQIVPTLCVTCNYGQTQFCLVPNGEGVQSCLPTGYWGSCEPSVCNSGYMINRAFGKGCTSISSLTIYVGIIMGGIAVTMITSLVSFCFIPRKNVKYNKWLVRDKTGIPVPGAISVVLKNENQNKDKDGDKGKDADKEKSKDSKDNKDSKDSKDKKPEGKTIDGKRVDANGRPIDFDTPPLGTLILMAKTEARFILPGMLIGMATIALSLAMPLITANIFDILYGTITDQAQAQSEMSTLVGYLIMAICLAILCSFTQGTLLAIGGTQLIARLRHSLFWSIISQDMAYFDRTPAGELLTRLASDAGSLKNLLIDSLPAIISSSARLAGGLTMMFIISWKLTLVMLAPFPFLTVGFRYYGAYTKRVSVRVQDALSDAAGTAAETIFGIRTVRWFSNEKIEQAKLKIRINKIVLVAYRLTILSGIHSATSDLTQNVSNLVLMWYGASLVIKGQLAPSLLMGFNLFVPFVSSGINSLNNIQAGYQTSMGSCKRYFDIIARVPRIPIGGGIKADKLTGVIEFRNVAFHYESRSAASILKNINITFEPGCVTALVGPSGGGKSTMASLIGRLYDPTEGGIYLDNVNLKDYDLPSVHSFMGIVNQEPVLFKGTVRENVSYGKQGAPMEEVIRACELANAHKFIEEWPDGYSTIIGERGSQLSGGQKQRIAIARAILKNPNILILDEATSELDVESEHLVQQALENLMKGKTVVIIAHRLSTVLSADTIAVITGGTVQERGTHEDLMARKGTYYEFVTRQWNRGNTANEILSLRDTPKPASTDQINLQEKEKEKEKKPDTPAPVHAAPQPEKKSSRAEVLASLGFFGDFGGAGVRDDDDDEDEDNENENEENEFNSSDPSNKPLPNKPLIKDSGEVQKGSGFFKKLGHRGTSFRSLDKEEKKDKDIQEKVEKIKQAFNTRPQYESGIDNVKRDLMFY